MPYCAAFKKSTLSNLRGQTIKILEGLKSRFEKYHQIQYTEAAIAPGG